MIAEAIKTKLYEALNPESLSVIDESHKHASHYEDARTGETHFLIKIRSSSLDEFTTFQKHKKIYTILNEEIAKIHAISIRFELTK